MNSTTPTLSHRRGWGHALVWAPLLLGGMFAVAVSAVIARRPGRGRLRRAMAHLLADRRATDQTQQMLREAIVGNDKQLIAAVFGPPRTAMKGGLATTEASRRQYLAADTWYYPFDRAEQIAVVIEFARGIARNVTFIAAPKRASTSPD